MTDPDTPGRGPGDGLDDDSWMSPDEYPRLWNLSAGHMFRRIVRAETPEPPEYVAVPLGRNAGAKQHVAVAQWNLLWETAQFRRRFFDEDDLPPRLRRIADQGDVNVVFVPRTRSRYHEYAPLFHLLPRATLERYELPATPRGQWPFVTDFDDMDALLPADFERRLSEAWAWAVWRDLVSGSNMHGFTDSDPIRILAHDLDFWVPAVTEVMQDILREFPVVEPDDDIGDVDGPVTLTDGSVLEGVVAAFPRMGSDLWRGEAEAARARSRVVEAADATGRLRSIIDAVRSNRVEDDFSPVWTNAREDLERKLYKKRSKVSVRLVELTDTIPVQGPETEVVGNVVTGQFLTLLNPRDRQIVVLLNSGFTKLTDIGDILGYANHSAISKRLKTIRVKARRFFDEN